MLWLGIFMIFFLKVLLLRHLKRTFFSIPSFLGSDFIYYLRKIFFLVKSCSESCVNSVYMLGNDRATAAWGLPLVFEACPARPRAVLCG